MSTLSKVLKSTPEKNLKIWMEVKERPGTWRFVGNRYTVFQTQKRGSKWELSGHNLGLPTFHMSQHDTLEDVKKYVMSHFNFNQ